MENYYFAVKLNLANFLRLLVLEGVEEAFEKLFFSHGFQLTKKEFIFLWLPLHEVNSCKVIEEVEMRKLLSLHFDSF